MKAISLGYHDVEEGEGASEQLIRSCPTRYALDRRAFREHLSAIEQSAAGCVETLPDAQRWERKTPVFLTFDDGALGTYTCIAEDLEARNWRGHFFITSDWIGRPGFMSPSQIRELHNRGHVIGSHTRTHPARMSSLRWEELLAEWTESSAVIGSIIGERVKVASVADGYYSRKVGESAAAAGLEVLFNSEPTTSLFTLNGCLIVGRYAIKAGAPPALSGSIAAGSRWPRWRQSASWEAKKAAKNLAGESYLTLRRLLLSPGIQK